MAKEVDIEARKKAGHDAAREAKAMERKPFGQTSPDNYPYTYWWIVGYNEVVKARG